MQMQKRVNAWMLALAMLPLWPSFASGQNYPTKVIRIVAAESGSVADFAARLIGEKLSASLGTPVIVENRGLLAMDAVAKARPDGYTLLAFGSFYAMPLLQPTSWDPVNDFIPVAVLGRSPGLLVVNPSVPAKSVKELIALAKAKPGLLFNGVALPGFPPSLGMDLFKDMAGVEMSSVPYKGTSQMLVGMIGGDIQVAMPGTAAAWPHVQSGRLRALAVGSAKPSALAPGLPTVAEAGGLPGYENEATIGLFAPARTPGAIVARLNQAVAQALSEEDVKSKLFKAGAEGVVMSPEEFSTMLKAELVRNTRLLKK
jgi:tripartite-type tricarboxylate transporter receptor subunit TctC